MTTRPYAAARRTLSVTDKLLDVNWALVLVITIVASVGFAVLYSVAGGHFSPWADKQILRFVIGLVILVVCATVDIRVWMQVAYPAYAFSLLLLIATTIAGHVGLGAKRWIELCPIQLQPSELMKISLILALARYLHGLGVEDVSKPFRLLIPLAMIGIPAALVLAQPNLGTATIIMADGVSLLFLAGLSWWWILPAFSAVAAAVPIG
ncbi:MAG: FtsW/RodA/SpoVE family cell cycle protein, partial [Bradyrhizobium sp.]